MREVSKGECIIIGGFNYRHVQWDSLGEDQTLKILIQDRFFTQHMLEPTRK